MIKAILAALALTAGASAGGAGYLAYQTHQIDAAQIASLRDQVSGLTTAAAATQLAMAQIHADLTSIQSTQAQALGVALQEHAAQQAVRQASQGRINGWVADGKAFGNAAR